MNNSLKKRFVTPLAALVLASFVLAPIAEARGGGGGGGGGARASAGGGGGGARANAGGGGGGARAGGGQVNNSQRDVRTNDVRNTSVNNVNSSRNTNVNANRNTNVNVNANGGGCCNNGWDNDYHPLAAAAVVAGTVAVIGSMVNTPPANCVPVNYSGVVYQQCGSTWYQQQGSQYQVIAPPY